MTSKTKCALKKFLNQIKNLNACRLTILIISIEIKSSVMRYIFLNEDLRVSPCSLSRSLQEWSLVCRVSTARLPD